MPGDRGSRQDIGVSMRLEVLEHKQQDGNRSQGIYCYWAMSRIPKNVKSDSKLWVASEGRWRGYFVVTDIFDDPDYPDEPGEIQFFSETWVERDGGPRTPFQGFTYKVPVV